MVKQWVDKFDGAPLDALVRGVIDLDAGNAPSARVQVLGRYSFENYLLDPLIVYGLLLEGGNAPPIHGVRIEKGDEHRIRDLKVDQLQSIIDVVCDLASKSLQPTPATAELELRDVELTTGAEVRYPTWVLTRRGHDLLPAFQSAFGAKAITPPNLPGGHPKCLTRGGVKMPHLTR